MSAHAEERSVRILIIDDNVTLGQVSSKLLEIAGASVDVAETIRAARSRLKDAHYHLILVDLFLPDGSGLDLLNELKPTTEASWALTTGHPRLTDAVRQACPPGTMLLPKPFSASDLLECLRRVVPEASPLKAEEGADPFEDWIGSSNALGRVKRQIASVAPLDSTVMLLGESGTGKELAAEAVHRLSERSGPFLSINCGAIPETLIANELFGHEKGSYTGANKAQPGLFERAEGGTVFLDEVTELPLEHQPHLLRVLETKSVTRIGAHKRIPIDVRIVAASNRVGEPLVENKILREDLFYRLMVFPILLPPLRERPGDIPDLVERVLQEWNEQHGTNVQCSEAVMKRMQEHSWPGNVRELKHTVQRLAILSNDGVVEQPDFFDSFAGTAAGPGVPVGTSIREVERRLILATLDSFDGDRSRTAATLGISQKTLYNRLKAYESEGSLDDTQMTAS